MKQLNLLKFIIFSKFKLIVSREKREERRMQNQPAKTITMKCYECLNFMTAKVHDNGGVSGVCPVCKTVFFAKQHSPKEKHIRIIKQN